MVNVSLKLLGFGPVSPPESDGRAAGRPLSLHCSQLSPKRELELFIISRERDVFTRWVNLIHKKSPFPASGCSSHCPFHPPGVGQSSVNTLYSLTSSRRPQSCTVTVPWPTWCSLPGCDIGLIDAFSPVVWGEWHESERAANSCSTADLLCKPATQVEIINTNNEASLRKTVGDSLAAAHQD